MSSEGEALPKTIQVGVPRENCTRSRVHRLKSCDRRSRACSASPTAFALPLPLRSAELAACKRGAQQAKSFWSPVNSVKRLGKYVHSNVVRLEDSHSKQNMLFEMSARDPRSNVLCPQPLLRAHAGGTCLASCGEMPRGLLLPAPKICRILSPRKSADLHPSK